MTFSLSQFTRKSLKKHRLSPKKRLGQSFLIDKNALKKIVEAAKVRPSDVILEVGPGTGNLTLKLASRAKKVLAVEKDPILIPVLKEATRDFKNVKIIQGDILKFNPKNHGLKTGGYKIVANLPYYITSVFLRKFLEEKSPPKEMVLTVQKEVAKRVVAQPPKMNLLAVSVQFYARPKIISFIKKRSFWPQPKVDSAIIRLTVNKKRPAIDKNLFFKIVKAGFSQPRKQLAGNLIKHLKINQEEIKIWLLKNKISPECRAESLSPKSWQRLVKNLSSNNLFFGL